MRARAILGSSLVALAACNGVPADQGLDASMRVSGASFVEGAMPGAEDGPEVVAVNLSSNAVRAGQIDKPLSGALDPSATAAAIGLAGDRGYWIVPAGLPDVQAPGFPTFSVKLSFSPDLESGPHDLVVRAVDAEERFGPANPRTLTASKAPGPEGALVVSLRWDTEADLDLHVVDPDGVEIWKRNINSYEPPPPGEPVDPDAWKAGAILDLDSNAACVIDGRREENVIWKAAPPSGRYLVRVDTFSLCAEAFSDWWAEARLDGKRLGRAQGTSGESDAEQPHDRGAGVLALEFEVP